MSPRNATIDSYRELDIWQEAMDVARMIYEITTACPEEERQGLVAQIRRSAVGIPSAIAQGVERRHRKEFRELLGVAMGTIAELETQLALATDLGFLPEEKRDSTFAKLDGLSEKIKDFQKTLMRRSPS